MKVATIIAVAEDSYINAEPIGMVRGRKLGRDVTTGRLWLCYSHKSGSGAALTLNVAYSDDDGKTWTNDLTVADADYWDPTLGVDSEGNVHLAYSKDYTSVWYRKRANGEWQSPEAVDEENASDQNEPSLKVKDDDVHIVWSGEGWGSNTDVYNVRYRKRTSGGWQTAEAVTDSEYAHFSPDIAITDNGNLHVVCLGSGYGDWPDGDQTVYRQKTTSWQALSAWTNIRWDQYYPQIVSYENKLYVVWGGQDEDGDQRIAYRENTSGSWSSITHICGETGNADDYSTVAAGNNEVHAMWWEGDNILWRYKTTGSWSSIVSLNPGGVYQRYPNLYEIVSAGCFRLAFTQGISNLWDATYCGWLRQGTQQLLRSAATGKYLKSASNGAVLGSER